MSRKLLCFFFFALLLCGCAGGAAPQPDATTRARAALARSYAFDAELHYGENTACAAAEKTGSERLRLSFTSPEDLSGLVVDVRQDGLQVAYRGMEIDLGDHALPAQSVVTGLWEALGSGVGGSLTAVEEDGVLTVSGGVYLYETEIMMDAETLCVTRISLPNLDARADVTNFRYTD